MIFHGVVEVPKPTVSAPDTDVTSRLCWSRYSRSSSLARSNNHITPNIKTKPTAKPAAAPHSPAVVPPVIPPAAAPTTVNIIGSRQPIKRGIADLSDRSHSSLFPVPQWIECRRRPNLWPLRGVIGVGRCPPSLQHAGNRWHLVTIRARSGDDHHRGRGAGAQFDVVWNLLDAHHYR